MEFKDLENMVNILPIIKKIANGEEELTIEEIKLAENFMNKQQSQKTLLPPDLDEACQCVYDLHVKRHIEDKVKHGKNCTVVEHFQVFDYDCFILMLRGEKTCNNCYIILDEDDVETNEVHEGSSIGGIDCEVTYYSDVIEKNLLHTSFDMKEGQRQIGFDTMHMDSPYVVTPEYLIGICVRFLYYCKKEKKDKLTPGWDKDKQV